MKKAVAAAVTLSLSLAVPAYAAEVEKREIAAPIHVGAQILNLNTKYLTLDLK